MSIEQKVAEVAKELAWAKGTPKKKYAYKGGKPTDAFKKALEEKYPSHKKWGTAPSKGASCDVFVGVVMRVAGVKNFPRGFSEQVKYKSSKYKAHVKKYVSPWSIIKKLGKKGTYVVQYKKAGTKVHTLVYSNGIIYEAGYQKTYGHVNSSLKKLKTKRRYVRVLEF